MEPADGRWPSALGTDAGGSPTSSGAGRACCWRCCSAPPLLWLGVVYLGSLVALLAQSFFSIDEFSGVDRPRASRSRPTPSCCARRTSTSSCAPSRWRRAVTLASIVVAFPIAYFAARYARGRWKALFYLGVMLPLWSSYLVKIYAWKMILAKEGIVSWAVGGRRASAGCSTRCSALPVIGGASLSVSYLGTFLVFVYVWLPFMILPMQAALERVPASLIEASGDLGAGAGQTFRHVILPLALPGIVAGSIFTFSLTLGDYIIPQIIGNSAQLHRHGGLPAAGHRREHPARRRLRGGADRHHDGLPLGRPAAGSVRCALTPARPSA